MRSLIVDYDLVGTSESSSDYERLIEKIKSYSNWAHVVKSSWIVRTERTAKDVRDDLLAYMDSNDRLFVAELTGVAAWRSVMCRDDWLKDNL